MNKIERDARNTEMLKRCLNGSPIEQVAKRFGTTGHNAGRQIKQLILNLLPTEETLQYMTPKHLIENKRDELGEILFMRSQND